MTVVVTPLLRTPPALRATSPTCLSCKGKWCAAPEGLWRLWALHAWRSAEKRSFMMRRLRGLRGRSAECLRSALKPLLKGEVSRRDGGVFSHCECAPFSFLRVPLLSSLRAKRGKNGSGFIYPARFTASSEHKHLHKIRQMFYEHGAKRSNLNHMRKEKDCFVTLLLVGDGSRHSIIENPSGTSCHLPLQERLYDHCMLGEARQKRERVYLSRSFYEHGAKRSNLNRMRKEKDCFVTPLLAGDGGGLALKPPLARGGAPQERRGFLHNTDFLLSFFAARRLIGRHNDYERGFYAGKFFKKFFRPAIKGAFSVSA